MPQVRQNLPDALKPFEFHGLALTHKEGQSEVRVDCVWCGKAGKLYVNAESGQYHCKSCNESGNAYTFMRRLWETAPTHSGRVSALAEEKGLSVESLIRFGVRENPISGDVVCPGFDAHGKVNQLYRWTWNPVGERHYWNMAKGTNHWLLGVEGFDHDRQTVYVCEALWDGCALWDLLGRVRRTENGVYLPSDGIEDSLLADANVVAVPSCAGFSDQWCELFAGKRVYFLYDNDHPDKVGRLGAMEGTKHAVGKLAVCEHPPAAMHWLRWGEDGYAPDLKSGYDLRDLLAGDDEEKVRGLDFLFSHLEPVPTDWVETAKKKGKPVEEPIACSRWDALVETCGKALYFHAGMRKGLAVMLAAAASVEIGADQLWVKFVGPPSSGKTTLADGLLIARKYSTLISILTGLHSGYKGSAEEGDKDYSVMARVKGKAAIIKDGDTLLTTENRAKTLSDLRDAYDRFTTTHYKNGVNREYKDHPFVLLVFGTSSLRQLDNSEMGQRMLDCVVLDGIDEKVESEIIESKKRRIRQIMQTQSTANGDRIEGKDLMVAKRMVGGYLIYLRENIKYLVEQIHPSDAALDEIESLAKFVAIFRARPSTVQKEEESRELGGRLFDQLAKLAYCLAAVLNKTKFDAEVMGYVRQIAMDTCRGKTLNMARALYKIPQGKDVNSLGIMLGIPSQELRPLLIFLNRIDIMEPFVSKGRVGLGASSNKWRLTDSARKLYKKVLQ